MYNDSYETCSKTYLTLRIYFESMNCENLTKYLQIQPTRFQNKGDKSQRGESKFNGWFLSTKDELDSKDCRRHIDYLSEKLFPILPKIKMIINDGAKVDLSCYWKSESGHGGPTISQQQFSKLTEIGIDLWFDIY